MNIDFVRRAVLLWYLVANLICTRHSFRYDSYNVKSLYFNNHHSNSTWNVHSLIQLDAKNNGCCKEKMIRYLDKVLPLAPMTSLSNTLLRKNQDKSV